MPRRARISQTLLVILTALLTTAALIAWGSMTSGDILQVSAGTGGIKTNDGLPTSDRLGEWLSGDRGPRSIGGLAALFGFFEWSILILIVMAATLALVSITMGRGRVARSARRVWSVPRTFRLRTLIVLVGLIAVIVAWELDERRAWRLRSEYFHRAITYDSMVRFWRERAKIDSDWVNRVEAAQRGEGMLDSEAQRYLAKTYGTSLDGPAANIRRRVDRLNALSEYYSALSDKYAIAHEHPRRPIAPDPTPPTPPPPLR